MITATEQALELIKELGGLERAVSHNSYKGKII